MSADPEKAGPGKTDSDKPEKPEGLVPEQIDIDVNDPMIITDEFDEADFDHEFDDDFEEEIEGEYDLEDDQYGEEFRKEFGHLTPDEDETKTTDDD